MAISRNLLYMVLGGFLALALAFGAYATFAQTDDGSDDAAPADESGSSDTSDVPAFPGFGNRGNHQGFPGFQGERPDLTNQDELLAEALGVSVEELQAAREAVRTAEIEQAVADGLLTQEQADQILSNTGGPHNGMRGFLGHAGNDELLAEELGVSVEALQAARAEVHAAQLQELIDAGVLTQEQADMMEAQQAVRSYLDTDAISQSIQDAYEAAIEQALADGAITQAQADQMLENMPTFTPGAGGHGFHGGFPGGPHGFGGSNSLGQGQSSLGQGSFFGNQTAPLPGQDA